MGITEERRLTQADIDAIIKTVNANHKCTLHLSEEQITTLKMLLNAIDKIASIVGQFVVYGLLAAAATIFTVGFWHWLAKGIKG